MKPATFAGWGSYFAPLEIKFVITVTLLCQQFPHRSTLFWEFMELTGNDWSASTKVAINHNKFMRNIECYATKNHQYMGNSKRSTASQRNPDTKEKI
ncbi:hypothetical protein [Yoonia litorea]|uniref:hypothetical protein n=1 Tax=Yoonia litorea TaxID=1123755 RepID=UPI000B7F4E40|nr:hypothetical protein [Yoonia litorea]